MTLWIPNPRPHHIRRPYMIYTSSRFNKKISLIRGDCYKEVEAIVGGKRVYLKIHLFPPCNFQQRNFKVIQGGRYGT